MELTLENERRFLKVSDQSAQAMSDEKRFNSFGDVAVTILGPLLIMLIIGSMAFFMLEIFYGGQHTQVLKWKFGLFTFAAVLISRFSIEISFERAAIYGFALAMAILVVTSRYISVLAATPIIAMIWWSASRLTWDCTFINDTRDTSAHGIVDLFQHKLKTLRARLIGEPLGTEANDFAPVVDTDDEPIQKTEESPSAKLVNFFFGRRQPNMPGLWVFYFILLGFPFFGLGQAFIASENILGRQYAASYFCVYMIASLVLLMTTSLIGLSRYLKLRNASMSMGVASNWLALGTFLAIGILAFTFWMPRPTNNLSIVGWLPKIASKQREVTDSIFSQKGTDPSKRDPSVSIGADSRKPQQSSGGSGEQQSGGGQGQQQKSGDQKKSNSEQGGKSDESGGKQSGGNHDSGKEDSQGKSGKSGDKKSKKSQSEQSKSQSEQSKSQSKLQQSNQDKSEKSKSEQSKSQSEQSKSEQSKSGSEKSKQSNSEEKDKSSESSENDKSDSRKSETSLTSPKQKRDEQKREPQKSNLEKSPSSNNQKNNEQKKDEKKQGGSNSQSKTQRNDNQPHQSESPNQQAPKPNSPSPTFPSMIGTFLQMLFWLALLLVGGILCYRYRKQIVAAWKKFLEDWRKFWENLFNRKSQSAETVAAREAATRAHTIPFASFTDPFATGQFKSWTAEQTVEYTFRALESWGRENGCPRDPDQTPHEYAQAISSKAQALRTGSTRLANLYCQIAYAPGSISNNDVVKLAKLWEQLKTTRVPGTTGYFAPAGT